MKNHVITIAYDGSRYKGWQRLKNTDNTIQEKIEQTLNRILEKEDVKITGSSRTDKGVHAKGQVANFNVNTKMKPNEIKDELNKYLPNDIAITQIKTVSKNFHSQFSTVSKTYTYTIWKRDYPEVFLNGLMVDYEDLNISKKELATLDMGQIKKGINLMLGEHDFKGFCTDKTKKSTTRTLNSIDIATTYDTIEFSFNGSGFLYNMVRILMGTLIEIGLGKRDADTITEIFKSKKREDAGFTAPGKGLTLMDIQFKEQG